MTRDPRQPLPAGTRIASYRIDSVLGAGGAAITYAATNMVVNRRVAIKEYLPIGLAQRGDDGVDVSAIPGRIEEFGKGLGRFVDEARALAGFRHPAVAPIEHYIQAHGTAYVVMPYVEGETLAARLRARGPMTPAEVDALLPPLLDALAAVHEAGLVHGDLKPGNVILQAPDRPVLIDFGSARQAGDAAHAHGSPGYAAPEIYKRRARATPASDVYALGAVLYRALTGGPPPAAPDRLHDDTIASVADAGLRQVRLPLLDAIDRALALEPAKRPATIAAFRALLGRDPAHVAQARVTRSRARPRPQGAGWAGVATAVVMAAVLIVATTTDLSHDTIGRRSLPPVAVHAIPDAPKPPVRFRDCPDCPLMQTVPGKRIAVALAPVTRKAFGAFVAGTGHSLPGGCVTGDGVDGWRRDLALDWRKGAADAPVACVSWRDARAYAEWLAARTGAGYRLAKAAEIATLVARQPDHPAPLAQRLDRIAPGAGPKTPAAATAPADPIAEWTADCWARGDGASLYCPLRTVVGWRDRAGNRIRTGLPAGLRHRDVGFRVVRDAAGTGE